MKSLYLERSGSSRIAYKVREGSGPTIVFLGGFRSDMNGNKAVAIDAWCARNGRRFLRFDYSGHGDSGGRFEDCGIGVWSSDALDTIDTLTEGPLVLVGSSMGGWVMSLVALARPERVYGMVGVAVAPDFTSEIMLPRMSDEDRATLQTDGVLMVPSAYDSEPYPIMRDMIEDGAKHRVLGKRILVKKAVRLFHGLEDPDVPWEMSMKLCEAIDSDDVSVVLCKDGDHRLSKPHEITRMLQLIDEVVQSTGVQDI